MNPWTILKISPTDNIKEIKRAYARELKITKPDENPAGFQLLYEAYQRALYIAEAGISQRHIESLSSDISENVDDIPQSPHEREEPTLDLSDEVQTAKRDELEKQNHLRRQAYELAVNQATHLLQEKNVGPELTPWNFLAESDYILESEFNYYLGIAVFKLFSDYLQQQDRIRGRNYPRHIHQELLVYCDKLFSWSNNKQYFQQEFGESAADGILDRLVESLETQSNLGVRGGKLERAAPTQLPRQEQQESSFSFVTLLQILFFLAAISNLVKHLFEK